LQLFYFDGFGKVMVESDTFVLAGGCLRILTQLKLQGLTHPWPHRNELMRNFVPALARKANAEERYARLKGLDGLQSSWSTVNRLYRMPRQHKEEHGDCLTAIHIGVHR
jgi:hypothetical protein